VELTEAAQALAVVEQSRVEKVRCLSPRLGYELTESKHVTCQGEGEKVAAKAVHGLEFYRLPIVYTPRSARGRRDVDAHHHPQRHRHPLRGPQGPFALARSGGALGRRLPAGHQSTTRRYSAADACAAKVERVLLRRGQKRLRRRRALRQACSGDRDGL